MLRSSALFVAALVAGAAASTRVDLMILGDDARYSGSVVNVDATATTVYVDCGSVESCRLPMGGATVTQGPSTWEMNKEASEDDGTITYRADCKLKPEEHVATCHYEVALQTDKQVSDDVRTGYSSMMYPVHITAGAEKLAGNVARAAEPTAGDTVQGVLASVLATPTSESHIVARSSAAGTGQAYLSFGLLMTIGSLFFCC